MVLTSRFPGARSEFIQKAIEKATEKGIICIAAAGNVLIKNSVIKNLSVTYPGWDKNCIAVAGTTFDATAWKGSCRGKAVAISAPAQQVYCAKRKFKNDSPDLVDIGCGTSLATACVAGIAALWLSYHGRVNNSKFKIRALKTFSVGDLNPN